MKETGKVIRRISDSAVEIEIQSTSACAKCGLCHFDGRGAVLVDARDNIGVEPGESVELEVPAASVILFSLMLFIFPLVAFFTGYIIKGIELALVSLVGYLIFLYFYDKRKETVPTVTRLLSNR